MSLKCLTTSESSDLGLIVSNREISISGLAPRGKAREIQKLFMNGKNQDFGACF